MRFAHFMATTAGRSLRIVAGAVLITVGVLLLAAHPVWGAALLVVGAVLVAVGALNVCPLALLFGGPFSGRRALDSGSARR